MFDVYDERLDGTHEPLYQGDLGAEESPKRKGN
jgi:hypothetical protein